MANAGKWIAQDRGSLEVEQVQEFEALPPASFPLAERIPAEQLVGLFCLREKLPIMKQNGPQNESCSPDGNTSASNGNGDYWPDDVLRRAEAAGSTASRRC